MADIRFIAAIDNKFGLAKDQVIPWDLPSDRKYFRDYVEEGPVLMGWNTFGANNYKPFGKGKNYVVSNKPEKYENVAIVNDLEQFINNYTDDLWIIGGGQIFTQLLSKATNLYITRVEGDFNCNVFFPKFEGNFLKTWASEQMQENGINFHYEIWQRN